MSLQSPLSQTTDTSQCWKLPHSLLPFVGKMCPNGKTLECVIFSEWDEEGECYSHLRMRDDFWYSYFVDHLGSVRHKSNVAKKNRFEAAKEKRLDEGKSPPRKKRQTILPFATKTPTARQVQERIAVGGVCPIIASGAAFREAIDLEDEAIMRVFETVEAQRNGDVYCHGILANKDTTDKFIQDGIAFTLKYLDLGNTEISGYKFGFVRGLNNVRSIFCTNCTGGKETVK